MATFAGLLDQRALLGQVMDVLRGRLMLRHLGAAQGCHRQAPAEVAQRLKIDDRTVRRLFLNEPGVLIICFPRKGRRLYRTLRIPLDVFERVLMRLVNVA